MTGQIAASGAEKAQDHLGGSEGEHFRSSTARSLDAIELDSALRSIREELERRPQIVGFLPAAETQLAASTVKFLDTLGVASVEAAAKRAGATAVDQGDVENAYAQASGKRAERQAWLLCLAGILAGGAVATFVAVMLTPPAGYQGVWYGAIGLLGVLALLLLIFTRPRRSDMVRRQDGHRR